MRENLFDRNRKIGCLPKFLFVKGNDMNTPKKKCKMVPMYSAEDFFSNFASELGTAVLGMMTATGLS